MILWVDFESKSCVCFGWVEENRLRWECVDVNYVMNVFWSAVMRCICMSSMKERLFNTVLSYCCKHCRNKISGKSEKALAILSWRTFTLTLKHNRMQCVIQNMSKTLFTHTQFLHINTVHWALFYCSFLV